MWLIIKILLRDDIQVDVMNDVMKLVDWWNCFGIVFNVEVLYRQY